MSPKPICTPGNTNNPACHLRDTAINRSTFFTCGASPVLAPQVSLGNHRQDRAVRALMNQFGVPVRVLQPLKGAAE